MAELVRRRNARELLASTRSGHTGRGFGTSQGGQFGGPETY